MTINDEVTMTLDDAVEEVLALLTGLDLTYQPESDRYRVIARQLNRAMRSNALEHEWSFYASTKVLGTTAEGMNGITIPSSMRPRIIGDDSVRFVVPETGQIVGWAYFMLRDALHKYAYQKAIWCSIVGNALQFSRAFTSGEVGLEIHVPVMREPEMFRLPAFPEEDGDAMFTIEDSIRNQEIDFCYPDVVILRAAMYYAMTDPVMQPRVQTLEAQYKDLMYQVIERDDRNTDAPVLNGFEIPVEASPFGTFTTHGHPHA